MFFEILVTILIHCEDNEAHREIRSNDDDASQHSRTIAFELQSLALYASTDAIR